VGLLDEGGHNVKETAVRRALMRRFGISSNLASEMVSKARREFAGIDLVKLIHDLNSGDEFSLHPTWKFALRRQSAQWLED
jgi:hypothetical protein